MDPRFLKWMAQAMEMSASNMEAFEKAAKAAGFGEAPWGDAPWGEVPWKDFGKNFPGMPSAPFSNESMEEMYREWLSMFGAVPKKDYDDLKEKHEALEARLKEVAKAFEAFSAGMSGKEMPEVMKPWLDFAGKAAQQNLELFEEFKKSMSRFGKD